MLRTFLFVFFYTFQISIIASQCPETGADLSYLNSIVKAEGSYNDENGNEINPFEYYANQDVKVVRLRLWHSPSRIQDFCGNPIEVCNLNDVLEAAVQIKSFGMKLNLSIHYSDYFADPAKQQMPEAWQNADHEVLLDSIANYTHNVLLKLYNQNTLPDVISVGNETTWGFIDQSETTNGWNWNVDADKFNIALEAIDNFNIEYGVKVKKAIHLTESAAVWASNQFVDNGVSNFDIIGLSYYPFFSPNVSLEELGETVQSLSNNFNKEIMLFETGFAWTTSFSDDYNNFISNNGQSLNYPTSPEGQLNYLLDLFNTLSSSGATALIYWEPAWITSDLCDKWGQGSSYENVAMHDFEGKPLPSFEFFKFCNSSSVLENNSLDARIYPNPIKRNALYIYGIPLKSEIKIFDISGIVHHYQKIEGSSEEINVDSLKSGIYFIEISNGSSLLKEIQKIIIQK